MAAPGVNPYDSGSATSAAVGGTRTALRWPGVLALCLSTYYVLSALTLPFVNTFWIGELAPLAIFQLPKSFLKSLIHDVLMSAVSALGFSHGSFSPDYIATHGWALGIATLTPALLLIALLTLVRRVPNRRRLIGLILLCALTDTVVTLGFDHASNLKLFNASYF